MRSGRGASVGVVAELVDVHSTLGVGIVAADVVGDGGWGRLRGLLKGHGAFDLRVSSDDGDCRSTSVSIRPLNQTSCVGGWFD